MARQQAASVVSGAFLHADSRRPPASALCRRTRFERARDSLRPVKIGILAGAFNPVTRAHVALAEAAREVVDEIVCVLPRDYPHKEWHGALLEERVDMLHRTGSFDRVEITRGGL